MVIIFMGVSGVGKTTTARRLAGELGWRFVEGDDFHPPENVARMRAGVPLTDEDRVTWLARLREVVLDAVARNEDVVMTCSALRREARRRLTVDPSRVRWVYLRAPRALIAARLAERAGHFMPPSLLDSQFTALEEPEDALGVDATLGPAAVVATVRSELGL